MSVRRLAFSVALTIAFGSCRATASGGYTSGGDSIGKAETDTVLVIDLRNARETGAAHDEGERTDTKVAEKDSVSKSMLAYERRVKRLQKGWERIIPNLSMLQYAGDIGMISAGIGWDYGKRNEWETYIIFGYTPKDHSPSALWTFTLKEIYTPWTIRVWKNFHVCPLYATFMMNTTLNSEFWTREPDRYPQGYYGFSSRIRFHIGLGQKIKISDINRHWKWCKDMSLYYEVSSCDLYIRQKFMSSSIPLKDILCLGIGWQYTIF